MPNLSDTKAVFLCTRTTKGAKEPVKCYSYIGFDYGGLEEITEDLFNKLKDGCGVITETTETEDTTEISEKLELSLDNFYNKCVSIILKADEKDRSLIFSKLLNIVNSYDTKERCKAFYDISRRLCLKDPKIYHEIMIPVECCRDKEERKLFIKEYIKIQQELDERKIIKILLPSNGESSFQEEKVTKQVSLIKNLLSVFNDNDKITQMLALIKDEYIEQLLEVLPQRKRKEIIELKHAHPGTQEEAHQEVKKLIAESIVKMFSSTDLTPTVQEEEPALVCEPCYVSIFTCCKNQLQRS